LQNCNGLKDIGVKKGDRVTIYLTMIPELAYMMLACSRIGAIHSIIFGGFSANSIAGRIQDCKSEYESFMDPDYLDSVNKTFNNFFFYYSETPLLVINTDEIDFVEKKCDLEELIIKINSHKIGREYYNPLGS